MLSLMIATCIPENKSLRTCCVTFSAYFLKGVLHYVEIIYEFLSILFIDYDLYRIFSQTILYQSLPVFSIVNFPVC